MKLAKMCVVGMLLVATVANSQINTYQDFVNEFNTLEKQSLFEQVKFKTQEQANTLLGSPLSNQYNLRYTRLELTVNPAVRAIQQGKVTHYYTANQDLNLLKFDLVNDLTVDSVKRGNTNFTFTHSQDTVSITLANTVNTNQLDSVSIYYHGVPGNSGFGASFTVDFNGNTPIMSTLSQPYGARDWWPTKQTLNDKIDSVDVYITCPSLYKVGSNGLLKASVVNGANTTYKWQHRYPIPAYLVAFAVSDYAVYSDFAPVSNGTVEILNYVYPSDLAEAQAQTPKTIEFMQLFDSLFCPYPFINEKYGHAQWNWGGGMEHQTMSFMGGFGFELVSHELAHMWFGDKITCGTWEDIWLNEGFATYLTGLSYEFVDPEWFPSWKELSHNSIISQPCGSVWVNDTTNSDRIFSSRLSYRKGSYLLHMLRYRLGDADFFQALRNYITDPALVFNYTQTQRLVYHLETQSGQNLTEFFNDWFYGEGFPIYTVNWTQLEDNTLILNVSQEPSCGGGPFFEGPVPFVVKNTSSNTSFSFNQTTQNQSFSFQLDYKIDSLLIDPLYWVVQQSEVNYQFPSDVLEEQILYANPNPANSVLTFTSQNPLTPITQISVYNTMGQLVAVKTLENPQTGQADINIEHLPTGYYVAGVQIGNTTQNIVRLRFAKN